MATIPHPDCGGGGYMNLYICKIHRSVYSTHTHTHRAGCPQTYPLTSLSPSVPIGECVVEWMPNGAGKSKSDISDIAAVTLLRASTQQFSTSHKQLWMTPGPTWEAQEAASSGCPVPQNTAQWLSVPNPSLLCPAMENTLFWTYNKCWAIVE